ncbi:MFS transporter [Streptomyces sp. NPDC089919]|uniref:MFS transporter n=1 Tax=Streptomyces sp. NPDC089919 TaxID=3155188 RepID=UPI0034130BED
MTVSVSPPLQAGATEAPASAWREVYLLAGMRSLSVAGDIMAATALTLLAQKNGAGGWGVMALLLAATLPPVLLAPWTGRAADRFDSKKIIVVVASLQALVCLAMLTTTSVPLLVGLCALLAAGVACTHPVFGGLPSAMVAPEEVPRASAISQTTTMAGMLFAPAAAGFLSSRSGTTMPLVLDALSFVLVALGGLAISTRLHKKAAPAPASAAAASASNDEPQAAPYRVWSDRLLRSVLLLSGIVMACACIINVLIVFYVRGTFGASEQVYGVIMTTWAAGMVPGALLARKVKNLSHETILVGSFVCIAIAILGTGLAPGVWWIAPFYLLGGIGNGAQATVTHIVFNLRAPQSHRGRAFAALGAVSNTGPGLGFVIGGLLVNAFEPRYGFLAAGALIVLALLTMARTVLAAGHQPAPAAS